MSYSILLNRNSLSLGRGGTTVLERKLAASVSATFTGFPGMLALPGR